MNGKRLFRLAASVGILAGVTMAGDRQSADARPSCGAPAELLAIGPALTHVGARLARHEPLTIVAVGSSSTQGVGASATYLSYPSRLEAELSQRFPDSSIRVVNRGKGGEEAPQMLARMERDVIAEHPDLVIWQLGTNAVLRHDDVAYEQELIERGIKRVQESGSDLVLMDMQLAPRVMARAAYPAMERLLADMAKREHVGLFRRFAIMQHWQAAEPGDAAQMIGPDGLHMTDRGYGCIAADLADAVVMNWRAYRVAATGGTRLSGLATSASADPPEAGAP